MNTFPFVAKIKKTCHHVVTRLSPVLTNDRRALYAKMYKTIFTAVQIVPMVSTPVLV